jgi:ornithine carbamoyltransferase
VLNALDDLEHPCQIVADLLSLHELWGGKFGGRRFVYVGDANNVCNSLVQGCAIVGLDFVGAVPEGYRCPPEVIAAAEGFARRNGSRVEFVGSPSEAAQGADILYTDVWVSMGDEAQEEVRRKAFAGYRIDEALLAQAKPDCHVMHDLPAHRGLEITDGVMDGPQSIVFDQAENRLHAQKAILELVMPAR